MITSLHNKEIKEVAALATKKKERDRQGLFIVEGPKMFGEAPAERISHVYLAQGAAAQMRMQYGEKLAGLSCETVSDEVFAKMSDTKTPQGILGTIFRTAEAAGADGVIMSGRTADIYNPKTIRSTMGSVYRIPFLYVEDLSSIIMRLREKGVLVYAAHLGGTAAYDACSYRKGTAFLIGNEANGLREETAACADTMIHIPMEGQVESLNAAVASSVLLFEASRQRRLSKS